MKFYTGVGSRIISPEATTFITELAVAMQAAGYTMRSGDADGADTAFQAGAGQDFETWVPWASFAKGNGRDVPTLQQFAEARSFLRDQSGIIPWFDKMTQASQKFHSRNYRQVVGFGAKESELSEVCFYCSPHDGSGEPMGGTRTAVLVAQYCGVPTFNLWFSEVRDQVHEKYMGGS